MASPFEGGNGDFLVVVNDEGQHSIWPAFRDVPPGWTFVGQRGERQVCLNWIETHWTDMRPLSLSGTSVLHKN